MTKSRKIFPSLSVDCNFNLEHIYRFYEEHRYLFYCAYDRVHYEFSFQPWTITPSGEYNNKLWECFCFDIVID